MTCVLQFIFN